MSPVFEGSDRVEPCPFLGRPMRQGSPDHLARSDGSQVRAAIDRGDAATAQSYLGLLDPIYAGMRAISVEWCRAWRAAVEALRGKADARRAAEEAFRSWRSVAAGLPDLALGLPSVERVLDPRSTLAPAEAVARVSAVPDGTLQELLQALRAGDFTAAHRLFDRYRAESQARHDLFALDMWAYPSAVERLFGQAAAEAALERSLGSLSSYDPFLQLLSTLPAAEAAAVLAEHLRGHFSGAGREGAVRIVEEHDRYRLIFDPCGSGGAMRRLGPKEGLRSFSKASSRTWGRAGDVPAYCAHCAQNEIEAIRRFGRPLWVTEFDPDPARPCGWTVFKDPAAIPDAYYARLGIERPGRPGGK